MLRIRMFCVNGISTSLLVRKMGEAAERQGVDADIATCTMRELESRIGEGDVALIGPQMGYMRKRIQAASDTSGVPFAIIPMGDYGMVNGKAVLDLAMQTARADAADE